MRRLDAIAVALMVLIALSFTISVFALAAFADASAAPTPPPPPPPDVVCYESRGAGYAEWSHLLCVDNKGVQFELLRRLTGSDAL